VTRSCLYCEVHGGDGSRCAIAHPSDEERAPSTFETWREEADYWRSAYDHAVTETRRRDEERARVGPSGVSRAILDARDWRSRYQQEVKRRVIAERRAQLLEPSFLRARAQAVAEVLATIRSLLMTGEGVDP
jgi:hypothetical protein